MTELINSYLAFPFLYDNPTAIRCICSEKELLVTLFVLLLERILTKKLNSNHACILSLDTTPSAFSRFSVSSATGHPPCRCILTASNISADLSCCLTSGTFIVVTSFPVLLPDRASLLFNWPAESTERMQRTKLTFVFRMASKMVS